MRNATRSLIFLLFLLAVGAGLLYFRDKLVNTPTNIEKKADTTIIAGGKVHSELSACNDACAADTHCVTGLVCYKEGGASVGNCRLATNQTSPTCTTVTPSPVASPTPTPTPKSTPVSSPMPPPTQTVRDEYLRKIATFAGKKQDYFDYFQGRSYWDVNRDGVLNAIDAAYMLCESCATNYGATIHISPSGQDTNPGDEAHPIQTIQRAQMIARQKHILGLTQDIHVVLHAGVYQIADPLQFGVLDGGENQYSVKYEAAVGENVVVSGGRQLVGWTKDAVSKTWSISVPEITAGKIPTSLYYYSHASNATFQLIPARFPDYGLNGENGLPTNEIPRKIVSVSPDGKTISYDGTAMPTANPDTQKMRMLLLYPAWDAGKALVKSQTANSASSSYFIGMSENPSLRPRQNSSYVFFEQSPALISVPFEWAVDRMTGKIVVKLPTAFDEYINSLDKIYMPITDQLLSVQGDDVAKVQNLSFTGIHFQLSRWGIPELGYLNDGAPSVIPAAVLVKHAQDILFDNISLQGIATTGFAVGEGTERITLSNSVLQAIGGHCVELGYFEPGVANWPPYIAHGGPIDITVQHNYLSGCGGTSSSFVGHSAIHIQYVKNASILKNRIEGSQGSKIGSSGMTIYGNYDGTDSFLQNTRIVGNVIHGTNSFSVSGAGIVMIGKNPNGLLSKNLIYDINKGLWTNQKNDGLFFNSNASGYRVENTIVIVNKTNDVAHDINPFGVPVGYYNSTAAQQSWGTNYLSHGQISYPASLEQEIISGAAQKPAQDLTIQGVGVRQTGDIESGRIQSVENISKQL